MTTNLVAGDIDSTYNFTPSGSMAEAIYDALLAQIPLHAREDPLGRMNLAVAVAKGVIAHLKAQEQAFVVHIPDGSGGHYDSDLSINV